MENKKVQSVMDERKKAEKIRVVLEFAGSKDGAEVEKEFKKALMGAYLEKLSEGGKRADG